MSLTEAHQLFLTGNPNVKIGRSKICGLRPCHILLSSQTPENVCVCQRHANFSFLLQIISANCKSVPAKPRDFCSVIVCDTLRKECVLGTCDSCKSFPNWDNLFTCDDDVLFSEVSWFKWGKVESSVEKIV